MRTQTYFVVLALWIVAAAPLLAQSVYVPFNTDYRHWAERYEIKRGHFSEHIHFSVLPMQRKAVAALADSALREGIARSEADRFNLFFLLNDNAEWADSTDNVSRRAILKHFYKYKPDFFRVSTSDFDLHVNPVLHLNAGNINQDAKRPYFYTRGAEVRGMIARRIGFYSYVTESQAVFAPYVMQSIRRFNAVPYEGFWKTLDEPGVDVEGGVSFLTARGYFTFDIIKDKMNFQFGHDKHAFGNGYRSLVLSDFSNNYLFMKINTQVWKLNYTNLFTQLISDAVGTNQIYPKKYAVFHHLSLNLTPNFNIGLFESVIFGRRDNFKSDGFELGYLNPIIFYRAVEQQLGSGDNAMVGLDFRWNLRRSVQLYGQFILDELKVSELRAGNGWWANKHGGQLGVKYIDVAGISNLDLQAEVNYARPYTYSHFNDASLSNHAHFNQPLAHPLGANFSELIGIARYQPLPRLQLTGKLMYIKTGEDRPGENWGSNILLDNTTRQQEYGNKIGQGIATNISIADFTASWHLRHNLFIDLKQTFRRFDSDDDNRTNNLSFTQVSLRLNIQQRLQEF